MHREHHLAKLPQLAIRIKAWEQKAAAAERVGDMTAWDDAQRNIRRLKGERTQILLEHH